MKGRLIILLFIALNQTYAQGIFDDKLPTSRQDTLRGSITPERAWWDLTYYHLDIKVEPDKKYISCRLYTSPSPRDSTLSRMPSSA